MLELEGLGHKPSEHTLRNLASRLKDEGYLLPGKRLIRRERRCTGTRFIRRNRRSRRRPDLARGAAETCPGRYLEIRFAGGSRFRSAAFIQLTEYGRKKSHDVDPFERTQLEPRGLLASDDFRDAYPDAFEPWADAEGLLWASDADAQLTTVGHKIREAMQAFATAMVNEHQPSNVDPNLAHARKRLGAVIAASRSQLGDARRSALEALGDLWEATDALTQRQEHGAQKEGEAITWTDARRLVWLTMFVMVEFVATFEDLPAPPQAHLDGGR